jgi:LysM domain
MSVVSVGQQPGATGAKDEASESAEDGLRPGDWDVPGGGPQPPSRLERELRSSRPLARELRAHGRLTREMRTRGSLAAQRGNGELRGGAPRSRAVAPARRRGGMRLTSRGRRALVGLIAAAVVAAVAALWLAAATRAQAANHGSAPAAVYKNMAAVVVRPGQTLWSIALRAEPAADPRVVISQIVEFNALSSEVVVPGERVWVPRS